MPAAPSKPPLQAGCDQGGPRFPGVRVGAWLTAGLNQCLLPGQPRIVRGAVPTRPAAQRSSHSALAAAQCGSCCTKKPSPKGRERPPGSSRIPARGGLSLGWGGNRLGVSHSPCVWGGGFGDKGGFVLVQGDPKGRRGECGVLGDQIWAGNYVGQLHLGITLERHR